MSRPEIIDIGVHLIPYEEPEYIPELGAIAAAASNAEFAASVRLADGTTTLIEAFDEGSGSGYTNYSFRGPFVPDHELAVADTYTSRRIGQPTLGGLEYPNDETEDILYQRYVIEAALGVRALRANDYWAE